MKQRIPVPQAIDRLSSPARFHARYDVAAPTVPVVVPGKAALVPQNVPARPASAKGQPSPSQDPRIAANPLKLSEAQLGFVPRPNLPLSKALHDDFPENFPWPHPEMKELNRRYLAQPAALQHRARDYQEGLWQPPAPMSADEHRAHLRAEYNRQRVEKQAIREDNDAAALEVADTTPRCWEKLETVDVFWRSRNPVGHNIAGQVYIPAELQSKAVRTLNADAASVKKLLAELVADYHPTEKFSVRLASQGAGFLVNYKGGDGTIIRRAFTRKPEGLEVEHTRFEAGKTGEGSGKQLLRTSMGVYMALGVQAVKAEAALTVGGYAWARYGYKPDDWKKLRNELKTKLELVHRDKPLTPSQLDMTQSLLDDTDPLALWKLADASVSGRKIGKELLLGSVWFGTLSLTDAQCMQRLKNYIQ